MTNSLIRPLLLALLSLTSVACRGGGEPATGEPATPETPQPEAATAEPEEATATTAEAAHTPPPAVEGSGNGAELPPPALLAAPAPVEVASHTLRPVRCAVEGATLDGAVGFEVVRAIATTASHVWIVDRDANLRRMIAEVDGESCALRADRSFGVDGVYDAPRSLVTLSSDASGRVYASSGIFETWVFEPGAASPSSSCSDPGHGYLTVHPDGGFALGRFLGRDIRRVELTPDGCAGADWPHAPVFANVQAIGFAHGLTLVGGLSAEEAPGGRVTQVLALRGETPVWRQGAIGDAFAADAYLWVHAIHGCGADLCVLDANARALHIIDTAGTHLARVDAGPLFGHRHPVVSATAVGPDGAGWFAVSEERGPDVAWFDGYIYRVPTL